MISFDELAAFCKRRGFVYSSAEIYGGLAGFWDFGPLGAELKNNIKQLWWKTHVQDREDIVGIDGSIITNPGVWQASGHVESFVDVAAKCRKCGQLMKAEEKKCVKCGSKELEILDKKNLMFKTTVGQDTLSYLRPETAQLIFTNFKLVTDNARMKLPFGIAQIGKAFRNEISPRDFLFRSREFEQMEIEYFTMPKDNTCPFIEEVKGIKLNILADGMKKEEEMTIAQALKEKFIKNEWHAYWLGFEYKWFIDLGANPDNFRIRQHAKDELAHYSSDCWDLEYNFPTGWKEIEGIADRSDYDLQAHMKASKKDLSLHDETSNKKIIPYVVAEPSLGVERAFLVFMFDAFDDDKKRGNIVLHFNPKLAPVQVAVFPLVNKLDEKSREVYKLLKDKFICFYDKSGSIGRRYARQDEIGTPVCVTIDFDSLKNDDVTIRDRETTEQKRVKIKELEKEIRNIFK